MPYQPTSIDTEEWQNPTGRHESATHRNPESTSRRTEEGHIKKWLGDVPSWVFVNETGGMIDGDNLRKLVHRGILKKAGLRHVRLHDLRRTFASLLIQTGESLAYVKEQLGHHSIQITVDTYGHLMPGGNRQAVDRLDDSAEATIRNPNATNAPDAVLEKRASAGKD